MSSTTIATLSNPARIDTAVARPGRMLASLMAADSFSLVLAVALTVFYKILLIGGVDLHSYLRLVVFLPAFFVAYGAAGLYSGLALSPPEEFRRCTLCSLVVFVLLSTLTVSFRGASTFAKPILLVAIALSVVLVPLLRAALRKAFADQSWWGYPAVIFGPPDSVVKVLDVIGQNPALGLKPIAIVNEGEGFGRRFRGIPVLSGIDPLALSEMPEGAYAVLTPDATTEANLTLGFFSRILVIPQLLPGIANLAVAPKALGGYLGLEMRQQAVMPRNQLAKRALDLAFILLASPVVIPLVVLIAICIKLDSRGSAFYFQSRIGRRGRDFPAWKFRSMQVNADEVLEQHLQGNPAQREEWEQSHKLKNDPRITRVGAILRKTSLDEIPQLWNVFRGEMSLVGPRPIVRAEVIRYGTSFHAYTKVLGGLTGLWQVSGRSDTSYAERVSLDDYYIRNWSVWLDLYILCRTISTVLLRKGAY